MSHPLQSVFLAIFFLPRPSTLPITHSFRSQGGLLPTRSLSPRAACLPDSLSIIPQALLMALQLKSEPSTSPPQVRIPVRLLRRRTQMISFKFRKDSVATTPSPPRRPLAVAQI